MEIFIGLWRVKPAWLDLSKPARVAYLTRLAAQMGTIIKDGAEVVAWGTVEREADSEQGYDYYAVWKFRSREAALAYERNLAEHGWGSYFEYVALRGPMGTPLEVLTRTINLS